MKLKNLSEILEVMEHMHDRGGVLSAEVEAILMLIYNDDAKVNQILNEWEVNK